MFFVRKSDNTKSFYELLQTHKTKLKLQNFIHYTFYTKLIITDKTDDARPNDNIIMVIKIKTTLELFFLTLFYFIE